MELMASITAMQISFLKSKQEVRNHVATPKYITVLVRVQAVAIDHPVYPPVMFLRRDAQVQGNTS